MESILKVFYSCLSLILLAMVNTCFAETIIVPQNTVISEDKTYSNVTLDLSNGSFLIKNNATLTIKKSVITGTLSEANPVLFNVDSGNLHLSGNTVTVSTKGIAPHPKTQSLQHAIQLGLGKVRLRKNHFTIDLAFTAGLFITSSSIPTTGLEITNNIFENFHGVLYLIASDDALISDNSFLRNSYGHIVTIGDNNQIIHNTISFSGNDHLGNSIDVIDSSNTLISKNILLTPTCHGIYILNSNHLTIDSNRIYGGITYAMNIITYPEVSPPNPYLKHILAAHKMQNSISNTIQVTNNFMSQNRFGIAASDVDNLVIDKNTFIQRFNDKDARKFWTDNKVLLTNISHLTWTNNLYKEAFTQDMSGSNSQSMNLIPFPITGGVVL